MLVASAVALALPLLGPVLAAGPVSAQTAGAFVATGALTTARSHATATLLANGEVLVAGGQDASGGALRSAELYNPANGSWTPTGTMPVPVTDATATLLADGQVLVAGGLTGASTSSLVPLPFSQLYDPTTGQWSISGGLQIATFAASAALLPSGQVLYAGGLPNTSSTAAASSATELYDPTTGAWSLASSSLPLGVADAQMAVLPGGDVLLAGGETGPSGTVVTSAEVYTPSSGQWSPVGPMPVGVAYGATAALSNGAVLVAGGETTTAGAITPATQIFNPSTDQWQSVGGLPASSYGASATLLGSGQVLYVGGLTSATAPSAAAELYNPSSGTWSTTGPLLVAEGFGTATKLGNGDVLVAGGQAASGPTAEAELYQPTSTPGAPAITSPSSFNVVAGSFNTFTITTTGTPAPTITESGALPPGMTFVNNGNGTATISGTPPAGTTGTYALTITASNGVGTPAVQPLFLVMTTAAPGAPTITSPSSFSLTAGKYASFTVTATGTPVPNVTESGALPPGVTFVNNGNGTATVFGTAPASAVGSYVVTVTASNGVGTPATRQIVITVSAPVTVSPPRFTSFARTLVLPGANAVIMVTASGSPAPAISESGALPPGMAFHDNGNGTATISGVTPAGLSATYIVTLTASNGATSTASQALRITVGRPAVPETGYGAGYWYTTSGGEVIGQGSALPVAPQSVQHPGHIVAMATTPDHLGYYLASASGGVFPYGDARWYGSIALRHLPTPTVAIAVTPSGGGYYLVTRAGNVFTFGDARWYGSTAGRHVPPIAAFALTPDGLGYWLVSIYGNIYAFGDARFYGSPANHLVPRVVAMAPTPDGRGYWVVTSKGNVFNYGDARWHGSLAQRQVPPVVAFAPAPSGQGYWVVTEKGNVFNFGQARWYGSSAGVALPSAVTAFVAEP